MAGRGTDGRGGASAGASSGGIHSWVDRRLVPALLVALVLALTVRGSYVWTNGAVNLFAIPVLGWLLSTLVGLAIAACCELLMSVAGREYLRYRRLAFGMLARRDLKEHERKAGAAQYQGQAGLSFVFLAIGFLASLFSGVWFLLGMAPHAGIGAAIIDGAVTLVATAAFLYFGALREDHGADPMERLEHEASRALFALVESAAAVLDGARGQEVTPGTLARLISDGLPHQMRARFAPVVAQLAPPDEAVTWWNVAQVYTYAGADNEGAKRRIRARLKTLYDGGAAGVRKDGKGAWLVSASVCREALADEHDAAIARQAASQGAAGVMLTGTTPAHARRARALV